MSVGMCTGNMRITSTGPLLPIRIGSLGIYMYINACLEVICSEHTVELYVCNYLHITVKYSFTRNITFYTRWRSTFRQLLYPYVIEHVVLYLHIIVCNITRGVIIHVGIWVLCHAIVVA